MRQNRQKLLTEIRLLAQRALGEREPYVQSLGSDERSDASVQLGNVERLSEKLVCARRQPRDQVFVFAGCSEDHDREFGSSASSRTHRHASSPDIPGICQSRTRRSGRSPSDSRSSIASPASKTVTVCRSASPRRMISACNGLSSTTQMRAAPSPTSRSLVAPLTGGGACVCRLMTLLSELTYSPIPHDLKADCWKRRPGMTALT